MTDIASTNPGPEHPKRTWKETLAGVLPASVEREIDIFETQLELRRQGKLEERVFAETRLRAGVYGQRYDNGRRHDGQQSREVGFPDPQLTKGPDTLWHALGMQRIKIPFGELTARQLEVLGEVAEEVADGICHVTTRQDIQLHHVHIDDTPDMMRRLAEVGITTREACGNVVRNVTGCPLAGVCGDEAFDVTPYAKALTLFLLGHPDAQDFGRKFKISFSGCSQHACALARLHDLGLVAKTRRDAEGREEHGFEVWVGGGLGAVPHSAVVLSEFLPVAELLPTAQAICRIFARLGEKKNRAKARLKFVVAKLGIEEFRRLVEVERKELASDPRWGALLPTGTVTDSREEAATVGPVSEPGASAAGPFVEAFDAWMERQDGPSRPPGPVPGEADDDTDFATWAATNLRPQPQAGYFTAVVRLPLGDLTGEQMRRLADLSRRFTGGRIRATVEQNFLFRWVSGTDAPELYRQLAAVGLGQAGAGTLVDVTACPGTDTCKLGIASSRGLAAELGRRLGERGARHDQAVEGLRIKVSGCFNSCGQHHVADLGFYGVSRKAGNHAVPHFQVVLGGRWRDNAGAYGLPMGAVPAKNIPTVVDRLTELYATGREGDESFQDFVRRVGKATIKKALADLVPIPDHAVEPSFYSDWGDAREYTLGDLGVGECAGEVVSLVDFGLAASERVVFEALTSLDEGRADDAGLQALRAMLEAARALARDERPDLGEEPDSVVAEFRQRFHDTGRFHDPYAGAKFANYFFQAFDEGEREFSAEEARRRIQEAELFIEAAHAFNTRPTA